MEDGGSLWLAVPYLRYSYSRALQGHAGPVTGPEISRRGFMSKKTIGVSFVTSLTLLGDSERLGGRELVDTAIRGSRVGWRSICQAQ